MSGSSSSSSRTGTAHASNRSAGSESSSVWTYNQDNSHAPSLRGNQRSAHPTSSTPLAEFINRSNRSDGSCNSTGEWTCNQDNSHEPSLRGNQRSAYPTSSTPSNLEEFIMH